VYQLLSRKINRFVAVSDFMAEQLQRLGVAHEQIRVVKSAAFRREELRQIEQKVASDDRHVPTRLGIVGQITRNKGHDWLVEAVRLLKRRGCDFVINVFGSG